MAEENDEDFISLDDEIEDLHEVVEQESDETITPPPESNNKLLYILIAIFTLLAFAMLGFLLYLYLTKVDEEKLSKTESIIENIQNKKAPLTKTASYEALVQKAKKLYQEGKKEKALAIYNDLSLYNKALTAYNIGVANLKDKNYDRAIEAFLRSFKNEKLKFESALNIAITAFSKQDNKLFEKYLTIATQELNTKSNAALFSYYRTLIDYYRGFYAEALVPLRNQTSPYYREEKNQLLTKLYTAFDNPKEAIKILEKESSHEDFFTLGLLYAKQQEYIQAEKYLLKSLDNNKKSLDENLALALVYNKMGLYKKSADIINPTYNNFKEKAPTRYPIKVNLKKSLFDPIFAQKAFQKNLFFNDRNKYSLIFYFAPYRLMSPNQTIHNIQQGAKNIHVNAYKPALNNLTLSDKISDANIEITKGIKAALDKNLYEAKNIFEEGLQKYPSSAQLHYNLALTYAKLYDFQNAYKHFKRSAVLDTNYYYAPIFSDFCAQLLHKERDKNLFVEMENHITTANNVSQKETLLTLIAIAKNNIQTEGIKSSQTPFEDIMMMILSQTRQDYKGYQKSASSLLKKIPHDLIANILHIDAYHDKQAIKEYAKKIQSSLTKPDLNYNSIYGGNALSKELYIQMLSIAGIVPRAKQMIENKLREKGGNDIPTLQALAYADIYLQEFDQAYAIYNNLIDEHKQQDSNTLFLASIASIGASHHENAIALLELSKLTNASNLESRYALGILYHEAKNLEGAAIQYAKIGDGGFQSRYFSFNLDKSILKP